MVGTQSQNPGLRPRLFLTRPFHCTPQSNKFLSTRHPKAKEDLLFACVGSNRPQYTFLLILNISLFSVQKFQPLLTKNPHFDHSNFFKSGSMSDSFLSTKASHTRVIGWMA